MAVLERSLLGFPLCVYGLLDGFGLVSISCSSRLFALLVGFIVQSLWGLIGHFRTCLSIQVGHNHIYCYASPFTCDFCVLFMDLRINVRFPRIDLR